MKLLKMYATWCQPCKMLSKIMEDVTVPMPIEEVNIEEQSDLAIKYGVRGVPTLVVVDDEGHMLKSRTGMMTKEEVERFLKD